MLFQCLASVEDGWPNIKTALGEFPVFAGLWVTAIINVLLFQCVDRKSHILTSIVSPHAERANHYTAGNDFRRPNLTSLDVRFLKRL